VWCMDVCQGTCLGRGDRGRIVLMKSKFHPDGEGQKNSNTIRNHGRFLHGNGPQ
jgi:hypothetical protein